MGPMGGYTGRLLRVDLTRKKAHVERIPEELLLHFRGGAAINAALAFMELEPFGDPFAPDNEMIFGLGPLVGTMVPGSGKGNVTARSPLRKFIGISGHGLFGMLKFAGYDHLIVTGRAAKPTVLKIENSNVEFLDAGDLWGQDVFDTTDLLWQALGDRFHVTCIGPAGEHLVRDAGLITNKYAAFARTGMGAVMGSKNLKAVALYGSGGIGVADRNRFLKVVKNIYRILRADPNLLNWRKYGTLISLEAFSRLGLYASKNYQTAYREELLEKFPLEEFVELFKNGDVACQGCPIGCKHHIDFQASNGTRNRLAVSCMNSVMQSFGTFCLVDGWGETIQCAETAARLGLDFMSVGNLISFIMELNQRGLLKGGDAEETLPVWGDGPSVRTWIRKIAYREGLGDVLAEGLDRAAEALGPETLPYAMHSKGLGVLYDPRARLGSTEIFSQFTNVRGYISNVSVAMVERTAEQIRRYCSKIGLPEDAVERIVSDDGYNVARLNKWTEDVTSVLEILGICQFPPYQRLPLELWAEACTAVTGIETGRDDLLRAAENMWHVRRAFNLREGAETADDTCPERFFKETAPAGESGFGPLDREKFQQLVRDYYDERGWSSQTGGPPSARMAELGMSSTK